MNDKTPLGMTGVAVFRIPLALQYPTESEKTQPHPQLSF